MKTQVQKVTNWNFPLAFPNTEEIQSGEGSLVNFHIKALCGNFSSCSTPGTKLGPWSSVFLSST